MLTAMLTLFLLQRSANLLHSLELVWFWIVGRIHEVSCVLLGQVLLLKIAPFNLLSSSFGGNRFCAQRRNIVLSCWACCALSAQPHSISCVPTAILGWGLCLWSRPSAQSHAVFLLTVASLSHGIHTYSYFFTWPALYKKQHLAEIQHGIISQIGS